MSSHKVRQPRTIIYSKVGYIPAGESFAQTFKEVEDVRDLFATTIKDQLLLHTKTAAEEADFDGGAKEPKALRVRVTMTAKIEEEI